MSKKKSARPARGRASRLVLLLILLSVLVAMAWGIVAPYKPAKVPLVIDVAPNQSLRQVAEHLADADAVRSSWLFILAAKLTGTDRLIKAGDYRVVKPLSILDWLGRLKKGEKSEYVVTIPEGFTLRQFREELRKHPAIRHDSAGWSDRQILARLGGDGEHGEGLFFPDTYYFLRGASDLDVLRRAHDKMQKELDQAWQTRAGGLPYQTPYELLTMASIVEKETGHVEDRGQIAGVFVNRLRIGMRLQTDPTVIYGMGTRYQGRIGKRDLQTDTPYNTYTRAGLPPTPIALPGRAALQAAANPAPTKALYFVSRGDGTSHFSESLDEHNQAVRKYILGKKD